MDWFPIACPQIGVEAWASILALQFDENNTMKSAKFILTSAMMLTCTLGLVGQPQRVLAKAPTPETMVVDPLKAEDRIRLMVAGFPDLSGEHTIATDGTLQLPMAGSIQVGGLTTTEAVARITQSLLPYVRRPQVGITILRRSPLRISVPQVGQDTFLTSSW